jgi:hypothetical protein
LSQVAAVERVNPLAELKTPKVAVVEQVAYASAPLTQPFLPITHAQLAVVEQVARLELILEQSGLIQFSQLSHPMVVVTAQQEQSAVMAALAVAAVLLKIMSVVLVHLDKVMMAVLLIGYQSLTAVVAVAAVLAQSVVTLQAVLAVTAELELHLLFQVLL